MDPKNWSENTLGKIGKSKNPNNFQPGDKVRWMPGKDVIKNNSKLKHNGFLGLPKWYKGYIKSINNDGSVSIEVQGIGDDNIFKVTDLLSLGHTTF